MKKIRTTSPFCSSTAYHAVMAAKHYKRWGYFAAQRYCLKRGVPEKLFRLAFFLELSDEYRRLYP